MDEISAALIARALDGLNQRYQFTAQNIANANSTDYRPLRVSFEEDLRSAAATGLDAIRDVEPRVYAEGDSEASEVMRVDLELATAAQTSMRYRALLDILGRHFALQHALLAAGAR